MSLIGALSSIATLILFLIYLFRRFWTAKKATKIAQEEFNEPIIEKTDDLEDYEENYYIVDDYAEVYTITFKTPIQAFTVYPIIEDEYGKDITQKKEKPILEIKEYFRENTTIYLRVENPEGYATRRIWIKRFDYIEVSFDIGYNGKGNAVLTPQKYTIKNTIASYLFYLLK